MKFVPAALVLTILACIHCGQASDARPARAQTTSGPTTKRSREELKLLAALNRPYGDRRPIDWRALLAKCSTKSRSRFDIDARDAFMLKIAAALDVMSPAADTRVIIMESIHQELPNPAEYDRVQIFSHEGKTAELSTLSNLGLVQVKSKDYASLSRPLSELNDVRGSNNGLKRVTDTTDAIVISFFDGNDWQIETWFWFADACFAANPTPLYREDLPPTLRAMIDLIESARTYRDGPAGFGPKIYDSLIGDFPRRPGQITNIRLAPSPATDKALR